MVERFLFYFPTGLNFVLSWVASIHCCFSTLKTLLSSAQLGVLGSNIENDFLFTLGLCPKVKQKGWLCFLKDQECNRKLSYHRDEKSCI